MEITIQNKLSKIKIKQNLIKALDIEGFYLYNSGIRGA